MSYNKIEGFNGGEIAAAIFEDLDTEKLIFVIQQGGGYIINFRDRSDAEDLRTLLQTYMDMT